MKHQLPRLFWQPEVIFMLSVVGFDKIIRAIFSGMLTQARRCLNATSQSSRLFSLSHIGEYSLTARCLFFDEEPSVIIETRR